MHKILNYLFLNLTNIFLKILLILQIRATFCDKYAHIYETSPKKVLKL